MSNQTSSETKGVWLVVDDVRDIKDVSAIARNFFMGQRLLELQLWTGLYIDHDLGELNTGYDLIVWALQNNLCPKHVFIVSANLVGRDNIARALVSEGYTKLNPYEFIRQ